MYLEIITPLKTLFSGDVESIHLPGLMGQFQVLDNHASILSDLVQGDIVIKLEKDTIKNYPILSGVFELKNNSACVLVHKLKT